MYRAGSWIILTAGLLIFTLTVSAQENRPRVGLVLGGGGAKGLAHVGVISVLDELRVPVDCIAGTSMGALVGGAYASGLSASQLESEVIKIDWSETVGGAGDRDFVPIERKIQQRSYANTTEIGIKEGKFAAASGLIDTQDIEGAIRRLVNDARVQEDFDNLPIPFRAVATDMVTGDMVVLSSGDVSVAMRASMALPGVFSPVVSGDQVLSDGGQVRNLPIDIGRELCADVVIAVWLLTPPPTKNDFKTSAAIIDRSTGVMIEANEKTQIATLTDKDVGIGVQMGDISTGSFERAPDAIKLGRAAAEAVADQLARFSVPEQEYKAWRDSIRNPRTDKLRLADVRIVGLDRVNPEYVSAQIQSAKPGAEVSPTQIEGDMNRVFATGDFEKVLYEFEGPTSNRTLVVEPVEKSWGPNFFRGNIGLTGQSNGEVFVIIGADHSLTWLNRYGGRWHNVLQVGRRTELSTDFYQPLDIQQRFFVRPTLKYLSDLQDVYVDGRRESRYYISELLGRIDLGTNIGTRGQLRGGIQSGWIDSELDTGDILLPEIDKERDSNAFVRAIYDTRDNVGLPMRGSYLNIRYVNSGSMLGGEQRYSLAEGVIGHAIPWRDNSISVIAAGGKELSGNLPVNRDFLLGGIRSFPGLYLNELRGTSYWVAGAGYKQKIAEILSLFEQSLYAQVRLQAGRMGGRRDDLANDDGALYGLSAGISGRTPLGAFVVSLGYVSNDSVALQFSIGTPVPEGNLLDQVN